MVERLAFEALLLKDLPYLFARLQEPYRYADAQCLPGVAILRARFACLDNCWPPSKTVGKEICDPEHQHDSGDSCAPATAETIAKVVTAPSIPPYPITHITMSRPCASRAWIASDECSCSIM
jgi:hypothetical protein